MYSLLEEINEIRQLVGLNEVRIIDVSKKRTDTHFKVRELGHPDKLIKQFPKSFKCLKDIGKARFCFASVDLFRFTAGYIAYYLPSPNKFWIAHVLYVNEDDSYIIWSEINPKFRGAGLPFYNYLTAIKHKGYLVSDSSMSIGSVMIWKNLVKHRGVNVFLNIENFPEVWIEDDEIMSDYGPVFVDDQDENREMAKISLIAVDAKKSIG